MKTISIDYTPVEYEMVNWQFVCTHPETEVDDVEINYIGFSGHSTYNYNAVFCVECGEQIEYEELNEEYED